MRLPGLPEIRSMSRSITGIAQPVQLHAKRPQIKHSGCLLSMTAQQANCRKAEALARRRQGVEMIGVRAAEADQAFCSALDGLGQVLTELEPFVAADQRVDLVHPQDRGRFKRCNGAEAASQARRKSCTQFTGKLTQSAAARRDP